MADLPTASVRPARRLSPIWLVPLAALALAGWLGYRSWSLRGVTITIHLDEGYGLQPGDDIRFRGITVGQVREVQLADDLGAVRVAASLHGTAEGLARAGSRFWVVRPRLAVTAIEGLETLLGPRYLEVLPGDGPPLRHFVGLPGPPVVEQVEPGDLEIVLEADQRGPLTAGAPVLYRQFRVGTVLSVGLASDAGAVEARLHIQRAYAHLVRPETRFWPVGGARASFGLTGFDVEIDTLQSLLRGGIALATPPDASPMVHTGHRFRLEPEADDEWLAWKPLVVIGSELLPPGAPRPAPLRATVGWRQGWLFKGRRSMQAWVLLTDHGLLGPRDLFEPGDGEAEAPVLEVGGREYALADLELAGEGPVALAPIEVDAPPWPWDRVRRPEGLEDCVVVADPAADVLPLAASRLTADADGWIVDPALPVDPSWHGACVLSRADGALVGVLLVGEEDVRVGLMEP